MIRMPNTSPRTDSALISIDAVASVLKKTENPYLVDGFIVGYRQCSETRPDEFPLHLNEHAWFRQYFCCVIGFHRGSEGRLVVGPSIDLDQFVEVIRPVVDPQELAQFSADTRFMDKLETRVPRECDFEEWIRELGAWRVHRCKMLLCRLGRPMASR